ncbi:MAG: hypothetical protein ACSHXK_16865 [Oceanococcus sp.]
MKNCLLILAFMSCAGSATAAVYPSTGTSWILPGGWEAPADADISTALPDATAVKAWEVSHADVAFGANYGASHNASIDSLGYMYNQILNFEPGAKEMALRIRADANGINYEDFFLHFNEDTELSIDDLTHSSTTPFNRRPDVVGYTVNPGHAGYWIYQSAPWDVGAWDHNAADGALYVLLFERFDELSLDLSALASAGQLKVEYPSEVDAQGGVVRWSEVAIADGSNGLTKSGVVSWQPPQDWQLAALHDGSGASFGGGPFFAQELLRDQGRMYAVRLHWSPAQNSAAPRLANVQLRDWMPMAGPGVRKIPGWDPRNDLNSDGYVDAQERGVAVNSAATARFRYESRAVPLGKMWAASSSWCVANLFDPTLREWLADWLTEDWEQSGLKGAYNDDLFKTVGQTQFDVVSGGLVTEQPYRIDSSQMETAYMQAFATQLKRLGQVSGSPWISGNISASNLFLTSERQLMLDALSVLLREAYLHAAQGLTGSFGLNKAWDIFALSAAGKKSLVQLTTRNGRIRQIANTEDNWDRDQETLLSQYYLINVPGSTYAQFWNHTFRYDSKNTDPSNFHTSGVPKNYAYQPTGLLEADIGVPANKIPAGYEAMKYMVKTQVDGDYTIIGDSTSTRLQHPELLPNGGVDVDPSYIFYLSREADHPVVAGVPTEAVVARLYTKGLVLYRTDFAGYSAGFRASQSGKIRLPSKGVYRRIDRSDPDNRITLPIRSIDLSGYEGAILKDLSQGF